jgi:uracil phosphoribosyltransferase
MTLLRNKDTAPHEFRRLLKEITFYLGYEATRSLNLVSRTVTTPIQPTEGFTIKESIALIPVLRAGLGMTDAMLDLVPKAAIHHIGMYRSKDSLMPVQYYNKLPKAHACDVAYILDPCIATSGTIRAVISIVKQWGAKRIVVISAIGAQSGVDEILAKHPDVQIHIAAIDSELSAAGMIIPGLGDAGDRQFCTPDEDEVNDVSPSKRKAEGGAASKSKK